MELIKWPLFSAPEPNAQVHYCDHALSVCRPSVVRLSVVGPSVVNFSHFWLLWNRWTEFNGTWQEAITQHSLPRLCFLGRSKKKQDGRPGLWLAETFSTSPLKPLNRIQRNLTGSKNSTSSTTVVFFGSIGKKDGRPGPWLAEAFSTSSLNALNGIHRNLIGSKISMSSITLVFFRQIGKRRWRPWPMIGWDIFDFSSETAKRNSTKLDRKQDRNVLYQVCALRADQKNKMAALASELLIHYRLLLWNRWTEFNETCQEARFQRPLPSWYFSSRLENQDGRPGLWLAETFSTSPMKPLNRIQRNLTGSKNSTSSTTVVFYGSIGKKDGRPGPWLTEAFSTSSLNALNGIHRNLIGSKISMSSITLVFFRQIGKRRLRPWPMIGWDIFDFSSETAKRNSTKLDRKQDRNVLYQVCALRADQKNKMAALASDLLIHYRLLLWNRWTEFNETCQEARFQRPLPSWYFSSRLENQDGRPGLWLAETFLTSPLKPLKGIQRN